MLDFTSALYLGFRHPSQSLRPWSTLTTGAPAALTEPPEAVAVAREFAELQGCGAAVVSASTFHLSWDLFGLLAQNPVTIFMDAGTYPITRWGVQRARMQGATVRVLPHHDPAALARELAVMPRGRQPVVVVDGFCPGCGKAAPLRDFLALTRARGGLLVTDDTQALGILGHSPDARMPYGRGGGGSLPWSGVDGQEILVFSSLAKALGVPMAVLAGSPARIRRFAERSLTRMYCSPPSVPVLRAAENALVGGRRVGETRRATLLALVRRFRSGLRAAGVTLARGLFPVQAIPGTPETPAASLHRRLTRAGVNTVLNRGEDGQPRVTFLFTSRHTPEEIDAAVVAVAAAAGRSPVKLERGAA